MQTNALPVAVFDSGLGGISVLRALVRELPHEDFLYLGDSLHAPYGSKSVEEVLAFSRQNTAFLLERGAKALVIACNTATSAAAEALRREYPQLPIIGTEPALKPAVERHPGGRILVLATAMTVAEKKFQLLHRQFQSRAKIFPVACVGLMEFVERGELDSPALDRYLHRTLDAYLEKPVDAVVLGCTHYPFLTGALRRVLGPSPEILDGSLGIAAQLHRRLQGAGLLREQEEAGSVVFLNSLHGEALLARSEALFHLP